MAESEGWGYTCHRAGAGTPGIGRCRFYIVGSRRWVAPFRRYRGRHRA